MLAGVEVTFTKLTGRRYRMSVIREHGPALAPRQAPGYDDHLPHEAVHLLVELEAGLLGGVFGRLAAGQSNLFWTADPAAGPRQRRRERKRLPTSQERADMARSELLASACPRLWELQTGHRTELPGWSARLDPDLLASPLVERIIDRLDAFAADWHELPPGESITVQWPLAATRTRGHSARRRIAPRRPSPRSTARRPGAASRP
jgi:hypothetical protein